MEIRDKYRGYIPVYADGSRDRNSVTRATVFPSNTIMSMRLADSASICITEIWAIIKDLEELKNSVASKYFVFADTLSCLQALQSMKLEDPLIGIVIKKCVFLNFDNKDFIFLGYLAILVLEVMKTQTLLPSLHKRCHMSRLECPIVIFEIVLFPLCKVVTMVRLRISFILSRQSWEIGSPPTGGAGRMELSFWWRAIILLKKRKVIFGGRDVVESFRFHPTLNFI